MDEFGVEFCKRIHKLHKAFIVLEVDQVTEGAACTALIAKQYIDNDMPLLITDCDHVIGEQNFIQRAYGYFDRYDADGGILCHLADNPKWSYTKVKDGQVTEVIEKQVVSNLANTGDYYYAKGSSFVSWAEEMIERNDRTSGEFYVAPAYKYGIKNNMKILPYMVNEMWGLGTPEDLEKYLNATG